MMMAAALKYTRLLTLIAVFFASSAYGIDSDNDNNSENTSTDSAELSSMSCLVNDDGFVGPPLDWYYNKPTSRKMSMYYELEYDNSANFTDIVEQLEIAMLQNFVNTEIIYPECNGNTSKQIIPILENFEPSFSTLPLDDVAFRYGCMKKVPDGKTCVVMSGWMTMYEPSNKDDTPYGLSPTHIILQLKLQTKKAAESGYFSQMIDGVSFVRPYDKNNEFLMTLGEQIFVSEQGGSGNGFLVSIIAGLLTMGTLLFGVALLHIRKKVQPETTFIGRIRSETNVV